MKEKNIMKNIEDFRTVVSSVFTTELNCAIKTNVKMREKFRSIKVKVFECGQLKQRPAEAGNSEIY